MMFLRRMLKPIYKLEHFCTYQRLRKAGGLYNYNIYDVLAMKIGEIT